MPEKPREYKKRIDEQRSKMRKNRDELIKCIQEYELVDERYKAETKQEILANFEKNERAEKTGELYLKIGEELANIDLKYQELEDLKKILEAKRQEKNELNNELDKQEIDGDDETTLNMQMKKVKTIKSKIEKINGEIKNLEEEIEDREREIKEIEQIYGKKEKVDETPIKDEKKQKTEKQPDEKQKKGSPKTLKEYKKTVLNEKGKISNTKGKILKLLDEGIGIDETLKEKIKGTILDVFEKYNDEIEGSLRMKSAGYMEDREAILKLDTDIVIIGGKPCYKIKKKGKYCIMWGEEQLGKEYNEIKGLQEIGGKPRFYALRDDGYNDIIWGNENLKSKYNEKYVEGTFHFSMYGNFGGKPFTIITIDRNNNQFAIWGDELLGNEYKEIKNIQKIGGKPYFEGLGDGGYSEIYQGNILLNKKYREIFGKGWRFRFEKAIGGKPLIKIFPKDSNKEIAMWGEEQLGGEYDEIFEINEIGSKPCFIARVEGNYYIILGNEQYGDGFNNKDDVIKKVNELKTNIVSENEVMNNTPREKREKVILERYQKKLNRDELLKIISGSETIDEETKKTLKLEILSDFYSEFKKATSSKEFQNLDIEYRELKKTRRHENKKSAEFESQKKCSQPEILNLDKKLCEIADKAMKLEDGSWFRNRRLMKEKEERNELESRQNALIQGINRIIIEKAQLEADSLGKQEKYGIKKERPKIKGKTLKKETIMLDKLKLESGFKGYKSAYMELINEKEKYMNDLLEQINSIDFGISDEKKNNIIERLKISFEKEFEEFKEGDEIMKLAIETEKWLKVNWKSVMEQINELQSKIEEKQREISELKSKGKGDNSDEIYETKERQFELKKELLKLKDQYKTIKTELEEKLKKYDGTSVDWTDQIYIETRDEKLKREEMKENEERKRTMIELKDSRETWGQKINLDDEIKAKIVKSAEKIRIKIEKNGDGCRLITLHLSGKMYQILIAENIYTQSDKEYISSDGLLREKGISSSNIDDWKNQKLKEYVKQKEKEGFHIPKKDELRKLLRELGKQSELSNEKAQIAMLMYLTGMQGMFFIDMYDSVSRELIDCGYDLRYGFCYYSKIYTRAPLLLYHVSN